jgi:hypothetical protein
MVEAIYSILYHGRLYESSDAVAGDRLLQGTAGVYVHNDTNRRKAQNYARLVPLYGDSSEWTSVVVELWVDRTDRHDRSTHRTDQWIQPTRSTRISPIWVYSGSFWEL